MLVKVTPLNTKDSAPVYTTPLKWAVTVLRTYPLKGLEVELVEHTVLVKYQNTPVQKVEAVHNIPSVQPA